MVAASALPADARFVEFPAAFVFDDANLFVDWNTRGTAVDISESGWVAVQQSGINTEFGFETAPRVYAGYRWHVSSPNPEFVDFEDLDNPPFSPNHVDPFFLANGESIYPEVVTESGNGLGSSQNFSVAFEPINPDLIGLSAFVDAGMPTASRQAVDSSVIVTGAGSDRTVVGFELIPFFPGDPVNVNNPPVAWYASDYQDSASARRAPGTGGFSRSKFNSVSTDGVAAGILEIDAEVFAAGTWSPATGTWTPIPGFNPGDTFGNAEDVNTRGEVVGRSGPSFGDAVAFHYDGSTLTRIGPSDKDVTPRDINNFGLVVGSERTGLVYRAFIWRDGIHRDLNNYRPEGVSTLLTGARALNDHAQVVGANWFLDLSAGEVWDATSPAVLDGEAQSRLVPATLFVASPTPITVRDGADLSLTGLDVDGGGTGLEAVLNVSGGSEVWVHDRTTVGRDHGGSLHLYSGARLEGGFVKLGSREGSDGLLQLHDAGVTVTSNDFIVGGNALRAGGTGHLRQDDGELQIDGSLLVWDSPGSRVELRGGRMSAQEIDMSGDSAPGRFALTGGTLSVETFRGDLVNDGGTLGPGMDIGVTEVTGNLTQHAAGTLEIELGGPDPASGFDVLQVGGSASLGGTLRLDLTNGFVPAIGHAFEVVVAGLLVGEFDTIAGIPGPDLVWDVTYLGNAVRVAAVALGGPVIGDYNASGSVEQGDLDLVLQNWGGVASGLPVAWANGRPTSGIVDQSELDAVLQNWGATAAPNDRGRHLPEPVTGAVVLAIGIMSGCSRPRRAQ